LNELIDRNRNPIKSSRILAFGNQQLTLPLAVDFLIPSFVH